jgi:hypothetical protein
MALYYTYSYYYLGIIIAEITEIHATVRLLYNWKSPKNTINNRYGEATRNRARGNGGRHGGCR